MSCETSAAFTPGSTLLFPTRRQLPIESTGWKSSHLFTFPQRKRCHHGPNSNSGFRKPRKLVLAVIASPTPVIEKKTFRQPVKERQKETSFGKMYRLYIINDPFNKREFVVKVLLKIVTGLTFSRAYSAMQEAHTNGKGLVIVTQQSLAEEYCSSINAQGIFSTIEPDD